MKFVVVLFVIISFFVQETNETLAQAEMFLANTNTSIGFINFDEQQEAWGVVISGMVNGLRPEALLGFHIHSVPIGADHNCSAAGTHFNPYNTSHGMPRDSLMERHVGDLGNIVTDSKGQAYIGIVDHVISLGFNQTRNITGLPIMIHNLTDDGGHSGKGESNTTGNAGPRIACGTIRLI